MVRSRHERVDHRLLHFCERRVGYKRGVDWQLPNAVVECCELEAAKAIAVKPGNLVFNQGTIGARAPTEGADSQSRAHKKRPAGKHGHHARSKSSLLPPSR